MDTKKNSAASDIPTFKIARVGNDRKRKGGWLSFLRGGGTRGVWRGIAGGSGASGAAVNSMGMSFFSAMLAIFLSATIGFAAIDYGSHSVSGQNPAAKKPAIFAAGKAAVKLEGDTSHLPSNANTIPNSLGYLWGSKDGLTPEERAQKEADAAAAAAAEESQRIADDEAAKKAEADSLAGNSGTDPAALLASAQADGDNEGAGGVFDKKFGSLSSSMGGGSSLSGGAGLSGGVNRTFDSSGSLAKGSSGKLAAMKGSSRPSYSKAGAGRMASSNTKGFARRQLANANAFSRRASAAGNAETSASGASAAFDSGSLAGNVIGGPGIGPGNGPSRAADSAPTPIAGSGPIDTPAGPAGPAGLVDCGADKYEITPGVCALIEVPAGKDANPWLTRLSMAAQGLLGVIAVLALVALVLGKVKTPWTTPMEVGMRRVIGVMGGMIAAMGAAIIAMGDYVQGTIFAAVGAFILAKCIGVKALGIQLTLPAAIVSAGAGLLLKQAASALKTPDKAAAPVAAQQ